MRYARPVLRLAAERLSSWVRWRAEVARVLESDPTWTAGRDFAIENGRNAGG